MRQKKKIWFFCTWVSRNNLYLFAVIGGISLSNVFPFMGHGVSSDLREAL